MRAPILIVEDDSDIRTVVSTYLERSGFSTEQAENGEYGLTRALNADFSLILLDWMLPGIDGPTFMKRLRVRRAVPVIMLTARGEEEERLEGFALGVDDYVTKPFSPRELIARVKAVIARGQGAEPGEREYHFDELRIDPGARIVMLSGVPVELTTREFDLLLFLARHPHHVFSREQLLRTVWGEEHSSIDRVVDVHVSNLRRKIEREPGSPRFIETVRGAGYRFAVEEGG